MDCTVPAGRSLIKVVSSTVLTDWHAKVVGAELRSLLPRVSASEKL